MLSLCLGRRTESSCQSPFFVFLRGFDLLSFRSNGMVGPIVGTQSPFPIMALQSQSKLLIW